MADGFTEFPIFIISFVAGAAFIVWIFISKLVKRVTISGLANTEALDQSKILESKVSKKSHQPQYSKSNSRKKHVDKRIRDGKQSFNHQWLLTSLKGHSSSVLDMDFSPNGKFLATCGEEEIDEPDPGGGGSSSGSEGDKENAVKVLPNRRQKKNRVSKDDSSPMTKKMTRKTSKRNESGTNVKRWNSNSRYLRWGLDEKDLSGYLRHYVLTPEQCMSLGYPMESTLYPGRAVIYKSSTPREPAEANPSTHLFDVNAREFVPSCDAIPIVPTEEWKHSCDEKKESSDNKKILSDDKPQSDEKKCARCGRGFFVMIDGEYLTQEKCHYHWGKLQRAFVLNTNGLIVPKNEFSCCRGRRNSKGCTTAKLHVWNGVSEGVNGPLDGYVKTKPRKTPPSDGNYGVFSMDCEMCFTTKGLELTKITVVSTDGRVVYDSYVKPENAIIDYNTRFSGITAKDLKKGNSAKNLKEVQNDLVEFINSDTILIGHGLENDLKALKMIHSTVIDTSVIFPHYYGLPFKRSLRSLVNSILKREIQSCGHDSLEDAKACMELMLWRLKKDFRNSFDHKFYNAFVDINFK